MDLLIHRKTICNTVSNPVKINGCKSVLCHHDIPSVLYSANDGERWVLPSTGTHVHRRPKRCLKLWHVQLFVLCVLEQRALPVSAAGVSDQPQGGSRAFTQVLQMSWMHQQSLKASILLRCSSSFLPIVVGFFQSTIIHKNTLLYSKIISVICNIYCNFCYLLDLFSPHVAARLLIRL